MKKRSIFPLIIIILFLGSSLVISKETSEIKPFFTLKIKNIGLGNVPVDYYLLAKQYLEELNIKVEIYSDFTIFFGPPVIDRNWDLTMTTGYIPRDKLDLRDYFTTTGSYNIFGLNDQLPYQNQSEELQNQAAAEVNIADQNE